MKQVAITLWCDLCQAFAERHNGADVTVTIGLRTEGGPAVLHTLDVCEEHRLELARYEAVVSKFGVPLDQAQTESIALPRPKGGRRLKDPNEDPGSLLEPCEICGVRLRSPRQNLVRHIWRHMDLDPPKAPTQCPDCEFASSVVRSVGQHRFRLHGFDPVAEAMAAYRAASNGQRTEATEVVTP